MAITWRDAVTTLAAAAAVLVERAYAYGWSWALTTRWTFVVLAALGALVFLYNAVRDRFIGGIEYVLAIVGAALAVFGFSYAAPALLIWLALDIVAIWAVSLVNHGLEWLAEPQH